MCNHDARLNNRIHKKTPLYQVVRLFQNDMISPCRSKRNPASTSPNWTGCDLSRQLPVSLQVVARDQHHVLRSCISPDPIRSRDHGGHCVDERTQAQSFSHQRKFPQLSVGGAQTVGTSGISPPPPGFLVGMMQFGMPTFCTTDTTPCAGYGTQTF